MLYYNIIVLKKFKNDIPVYEVKLIFLVNINFIINLKLLILFDGIEKLINDKIFNFHVTIISGLLKIN